MSDCHIEVIDVDDGEVTVKVQCNFVYSKQEHIRADIRKAFEETMARFAI